MYAAVRVYPSLRDLDEISHRAEESFVPMLRQIDGFRGYYLIDTGDGGGATISLFDDQASAEESSRKAAEWVSEHFAAKIDGAPQIITGEVRIHHHE